MLSITAKIKYLVWKRPQRILILMLIFISVQYAEVSGSI